MLPPVLLWQCQTRFNRADTSTLREWETLAPNDELQNLRETYAGDRGHL